MSGNVFLVCMTVIIIGAMFVYCHHQEHMADMSDDRYQFLCGKNEELRKQYDSLHSDFDELVTAVDELQEEVRVLSRGRTAPEGLPLDSTPFNSFVTPQ